MLNLARPRETIPFVIYQFIYQFGGKKGGFLKIVKNVAQSEKSQKTKKDEGSSLTPRPL
jgi:hypothetical protein